MKNLRHSSGEETVGVVKNPQYGVLAMCNRYDRYDPENTSSRATNSPKFCEVEAKLSAIRHRPSAVFRCKQVVGRII